MAHVTNFNTDKKYRATVVRTERLTPDNTDEVREISFRLNQPGFECKVDQSFGVLVNKHSDFGNPYHHRLYSVADIPQKENGNPQITMLVKRCFYVDEFSGEQYKGVASNYLCDRMVGDEITITGPHHLPFRMPDDKSANLLLIGMGTGIAPFRAFVKHIYKNVKNWEGQVRLFYGARTGLELLYMNDKNDDLTNYYDEATFEAFHALSPRPQWSDDVALDAALEERAEEIRELLNQVNTYVYVSGYKRILGLLEKAFSNILGSEEKWATRKAELVAGGKWAEIIY